MGCVRLTGALIFLKSAGPSPCLADPDRPEDEKVESVQAYLRNARGHSEQDQD
jgi:hypothetical protein